MKTQEFIPSWFDVSPEIKQLLLSASNNWDNTDEIDDKNEFGGSTVWNILHQPSDEDESVFLSVITDLS